jgi:hypothetical protein
VTVHVSKPLDLVLDRLLTRKYLIEEYGLDAELLEECLRGGAFRTFNFKGTEYIDARPLLKFMAALIAAAREHQARAAEMTPRESTDRGTVRARDEETPPVWQLAGSQKLDFSAPGHSSEVAGRLGNTLL